MILDARHRPVGIDLAADVAIVGAGPAGITVANRLRGSGLKVVLIEAGGQHVSLRDQRLYAGENIGHPYFRLDGCRYRLLGGSSNRWGGWCRPLEKSDFEARSWVRDSGWPITAADLEPYYRDASALFDLPSARFDLASWLDKVPPPVPLGAGDFENTIFQYSPETNFGQEHQRVFSADP